MAFYEGAVMRIKLDTKEVLHEVDADIQASTDFKDVASKDTGGKISTPGAQSFTISCNTSLLDNDGTTQEDLFTMATKWKAKTKHAVTFTTGTSGDVIFSGDVYIESFSSGAVNEESSSASYTLRGTGELTIAQVA